MSPAEIGKSYNHIVHDFEQRFSCQKIERIRLTMIRRHMRDIPDIPLPFPYRIRTFQPGDEQRWAYIERKAGEFPSQEKAELRFTEEFGTRLDEMKHRCFLLEDGDGKAVGTATAWYNTLQAEVYGRIHWVAVIPEYQGRGLAKPLLSRAMKTLSEFHDKAYLTTQTTSWKAIRMYLQFGFEPWLVSEHCRMGWSLIETLLQQQVISPE